MPFLIRVFSKRRLLWLIAAGICAAPVTRVMASRLWLGHPLASYLLTPCRMDALLFGVVGAYLVRQDTWRTSLERRPNALKCALAVLLAGMAIFTKYGNIVFFQHLMVQYRLHLDRCIFICAACSMPSRSRPLGSAHASVETSAVAGCNRLRRLPGPRLCAEFRLRCALFTPAVRNFQARRIDRPGARHGGHLGLMPAVLALF